MPTNTKPLTPADLSALEHAFASDPASDAYRPLTEAYLSMGRFMEAMVVCKKGVKAHPDDPAARVLLARIYADQGKDRKALEELQGILAAYPTFVAANRLAGVLHLRVGDRAKGEAALRRALEGAPDDPEVRAALSKYGVTAKAPAAAAPPPAPERPAGRSSAPPPMARAQQKLSDTGDILIDEAPIPTPVPAKRERNVQYAEELADKYATREYTLTSTISGGQRLRRPSKRGTLATTAALFVVLALALGGWAVFNKTRKAKIEAIDRLLKDTVPLVEKDSYPAYVDAAAKCKEILDHDSSSIAGHSFLAYVDAVRSGEHGDDVKAEAVAHVEEARKIGQRHSHLVAAEAYLKLYGGDAAGAKETVRGVIEGEEAAQSPFLLGVLGAIELQDGDLDHARDTLNRAQKASPGDVRVAWLLAEQFRRRGEGYDTQAAAFYDYALRIQKDHVASILGKAALLVARGQAEEAARAAQSVLSGQVASKPQQALAHAILGGANAVEGKREQALSEEQQAAKLDPASAEIPHLLGVRKLREGDTAGAIEAFQRAVTLDARRVSLYADLVRALLRKEGGAKQAIDTVKRAVQRLGEHPRLALVLGDAYRASGDADLARGQYEKAIQLGKPYPDARVALARLHRSRNNIPGALVELTQAIDEYGSGGAGGAAEAYVEMAEAERSRGAALDKLKELYLKAVEKDPASCEALWGASKAEIDLGKLGDDGKRRLDAYARLCPRAEHAAEAARLAAK